MSKNQFMKEVKGMMNSVRVVGGVRIANVGWLNKPWMIIENDENFDDAKADNFIPIDHFRTASDLFETYANQFIN